MVASSPEATPWVELRPAEPEDAPLLFRWRSEPSVLEHQRLPAATLADIRADLERQSRNGLRGVTGERRQWIVLVDGRPAGWITLALVSWDQGLAEVGYALSTPYQGRGIMTRALGVLVAELFASTRLERLEARCSVEHRASQRVLEKLGFRREGVLRECFEVGGRRLDHYLYALLRREVLPDG